jgi:hypothetical protein
MTQNASGECLNVIKMLNEKQGMVVIPCFVDHFNSSGSTFFLQPCSFARTITKEVKLGTTDMGTTLYNYLLNPRGSEKEGSFDADAVRCDTPDSEVGIVATFTHADNGASKFLHSFAITLLDTYVYTHCIARMKLWNLGIYRHFNCLKMIRHGGFPLLLSTHYRPPSFYRAARWVSIP